MRVLSVVAVSLLPAYAFRLAYLTLFDGTGRVVDGVLAFDGQAWVVLAAAGLVWLTTVLLGVAVLDGGPSPLRRTRQALPGAIGVLALLWALIGFAAVIVNSGLAAESPTGLLLIAVVGASVAAAATPPLMWVVAAVVRDDPRPGAVQLTGRRWHIGAELAGGLVVPALVAATAAKIVPSTSFLTSIASTVFSTALIAATVVVQSMVLLHAYLHTDPEARPEAPAQRRPPRWLLAAGITALFLPAALNAGVVAAAGLPTVTRVAETVGQAWALSWPTAGRGPVVVGNEEIVDCLDDTCSRQATTDLTIAVTQPTGNAVVLPDGTVYAFGQAGIEICDPQRHCEGGRTRGMIDQLGVPRAAQMAVGGDGNPVIATIAVSAEYKTVEVNLHRCRDRLCHTSDATALGSLPYATPMESWDRRMVAVDIAPSGHVAVGVRWPSDVGGTNRIQKYGAPDVDQAARLEASFAKSRAVVGADGRFYVLNTLHHGQTSRTELLICRGLPCGDGQRIQVDQLDGLSSTLPGVQPDELWLLAVSPDGHVAAVCPYLSERFFTISP